MEGLRKVLSDSLSASVLLGPPALSSAYSHQVGGSALLSEYIALRKSAAASGTNQSSENAWKQGPIWKTLYQVQSYVVVLTQICKSDHSEQIKSTCLEQWASPLGHELVHTLSKLYVFLAWEQVAIKSSLYETETVLEVGYTSQNGELRAQLLEIRNWLQMNLSVSRDTATSTTTVTASLGSPMEVDPQASPPESSSPSAAGTCAMDTSVSGPSTSAHPSVLDAPTHAQHMIMKKFLDPLMHGINSMYRSVEDFFSTQLLKLSISSQHPGGYSRRSALMGQNTVPTPNARGMAKQLMVIPMNSSRVTQLDMPLNLK